MHVISCFRTANSPGGGTGLDPRGLLRFRALFLVAAEIPAQALNAQECEQEFERFDFSGNGRLELNEVYKLVKFSLRSWQKLHGDAAFTATIPTKSLQQAGYRVVRELGQGSQGSVNLATNRQGQEVCMKAYQKSALQGIDELKDEFETMQLLSCERIAKAFELFQDSLNYYIIGEVYHGGDLTALNRRIAEQGIATTEDWWRHLFKQCLEALAFMHEQAMMHCDAKEANIMLRTPDLLSPKAVLIDFGVSKAMTGSAGICGTPGYIPPETWNGRKWFPKGDIFSLGVVMIQLVTDKVPPTGARRITTPGGIFIEGCATMEDIAAATHKRAPPYHLIPRELPGLSQLLVDVLQKQMRTRPSPQQALTGPWLAAAKSFRPAAPAGAGIVGGGKATLTPRGRVGFAPMDAGGEDGAEVEKIRPRHSFATFGITKSFLAKNELDEDGNPVHSNNAAVDALREVLAEVEDGSARGPYVNPGSYMAASAVVCAAPRAAVPAVRPVPRLLRPMACVS